MVSSGKATGGNQCFSKGIRLLRRNREMSFRGATGYLSGDRKVTSRTVAGVHHGGFYRERAVEDCRSL